MGISPFFGTPYRGNLAQLLRGLLADDARQVFPVKATGTARLRVNFRETSMAIPKLLED